MSRRFDTPLPSGTAETVRIIRRSRQKVIEDAIYGYASLARPNGFYLDTVRLDMLHEARENPKLIGLAVRNLLYQKKLVKTGRFRKSNNPASHRREIFELKFNDTGDYSS